MESKEVILHIDRSKLSRREQYQPKAKEAPKHVRRPRRRRSHDKARFWQITSFAAVILLIFSIYLNHRALTLVGDLQTDLQNSINNMADMQEAYKQLGSMYLAEKELREQEKAEYQQQMQPAQNLENTPEVIYAMDQQITTLDTPVEEPELLFPEQFNAVPLDAEIVAYIYEAAMTADIKPEILFSIAWKESNFTSNVVSPTNDYGMFQINKCNFKSISEHFDIPVSEVPNKLLNDPEFCADCSIFILTTVIADYGPGDYHQLMMIYNMGIGNATKCFNRGYYSSEYSRKVIGYATENYGLTDAGL